MSRRAWAWVIGGYTVMAIGFVIVLFVLADQIRTVKATQRAAATIAVHNAGAICLGLTAPTKVEEQAIVAAFLEGDGHITAQFTPTCARAAKKAAEDIFGPSGIPTELRRELDAAGTPDAVRRGR